MENEILDYLLVGDKVIAGVEDPMEFCKGVSCRFLKISESNFYRFISPDGDEYIIRITPCIRLDCDNHCYEEGAIKLADLKPLFDDS